MKSKVVIKRYGRMRGLERTKPLTCTFSEAETRLMTIEATAHLCSVTDVIRSALVYAGIIEDIEGAEVAERNDEVAAALEKSMEHYPIIAVAPDGAATVMDGQPAKEA